MIMSDLNRKKRKGISALLCNNAMSKCGGARQKLLWIKNASRKNVATEEMQKVIRHVDMHLETQNKA